MTRTFLWRTPLTTGVAVLLLGCTQDTRVTPATVPAVTSAASQGARIQFADVPDQPGMVTLRVQVLRNESDSRIGSFTGSIQVDPAVLRFVGNASPDGGSVIINAEPSGTVRLAGFSTDGFRDGIVAALLFERLTPAEPSPLLSFIQLHTTTGDDLTATPILPSIRVEAP